MFELGQQSPKQHLRLGEAAAKARLDRLYLLGAEAQRVRAGALRAGMSAQRITIGVDHADIARRLTTHIKQGDWLLVKGSRGMAMEKVLDKLKG
jgi:UDP-N-acetylmuramyl pentapeptide synthase